MFLMMKSEGRGVDKELDEDAELLPTKGQIFVFGLLM